MKKHTPKILILFLLMLLWCVPLKAQITVGDSVIFWLDTHVNGFANDWDYVIAYLYDSESILDSVALTLIDSGEATVHYSGSYAPVPKGIYIIDYHAWLDDSITKTAEEISVIDPADFKYSGGTCNAPTGAYQVDVSVKKSSDSTAINDCLVLIYNYDQSTLIWWDFTNALGKMNFMYDEDSLIVKLNKPLYNFTIPETLWIDGNEDTAYYGSTAPVGNPPAPNLCRCYGYVKNLVAGFDTTMIIEITNTAVPLRYSGIIISPFKVWDNPKDTTGYFYFDIYKSSLLEPDTSNYLLIIRDTDGNNLLEQATGETGILFQAPDSLNYWITW